MSWTSTAAGVVKYSISGAKSARMLLDLNRDGSSGERLALLEDFDHVPFHVLIENDRGRLRGSRYDAARK